MKKHFITLTTGESFPVEISLGAMLIFKEETGREATDADMGSLSDLIKLLWAGAAAGSGKAGSGESIRDGGNRDELHPAAVCEPSHA